MMVRENNVLKNIKVVLAPLAGITDSVFRKICMDYGADMVFSEMVSARGLIEDPERLHALRNLDTGEYPIALQIFGSDPSIMARAARRLSFFRPCMIDINLGCPAKKVVKHNCGAALLKEPLRLARICREVVARSLVPVSVKIRAGWDKISENTMMELGKIIEDAGVQVITLHARSRTQAFKDKADWNLIRMLKEELSIPVIGNGDVRCADDFFRMQSKTRCDAVMIGRGAIGNPWIFREIKARLARRAFSPPSTEERLKVLVKHLIMSIEVLGESLGIISSRKVMAAYVRYLPGAARLRARLMNCVSFRQVEEALEEHLSESSRVGIAASSGK